MNGTTLTELGHPIEPEHIPVPQTHRERKDILIAKQTHDTITYIEKNNPDAYLTTDTLVEVRD